MSRLALLLLLLLLLAGPAAAQFGPREDAKPAPVPEALPAIPKADPKSTHTNLNKEGTLVLEKKPDGTSRVLFQGEVCLKEGYLEVFLCRKGTKEHEAVVRADLDAQFIHAAILACGAKPGKPVQFVDPKTGDSAYKPASGPTVAVTVVYNKGGKLLSHPAQDWIQSIKTKKPMDHKWVFAGSRFVKNPDKPDDPDYYCANNGEIIGISNFPDSMLDLPVEVSQNNDELAFQVFAEKLPPLRSKIWVILEPEAEKKK